MRFRRNSSLVIDAGAGAFSMGTSGSAFNLQPSTNNSSVTFTLTNNSTNTATLGDRISFQRGSGGSLDYLFNGSGNWDVSGAFSNSGNISITKSGSGVLTLSAANSHVSGTTLTSGILRVTNTAGFGSGLVTLNGGTLQLLHNGAGNGDVVTYNTGEIRTNSGNTATIHVGNNGANTNNLISLNHSSEYNLGNATLNVTGANGYALEIKTFRAGAGVSGTAILNPTTANLILGTVANINSSHTLQLGGTSSGNRVTDVISNGAGTLTILKTGTSRWTFEGANTYTGATTINGGTLLFNNTTSSGAGTGAVTVNNGGTLGGTGRITGSIIVNSGGTLAPGASIQSFASGTLNFNSGSTFGYEIDSAAPLSSAADLQVVSGNLNLSGTVKLSITDLAPSNDFLFLPNTIFTLINYTGTWNNGLFTFGGDLLGDDAQFIAGKYTWLIDYNATSGGVNFTGDYLSGKFVNLTLMSLSVPEPSTLLLLASALLIPLPAAYRRRRRLAQRAAGPAGDKG